MNLITKTKDIIDKKYKDNENYSLLFLACLGMLKEYDGYEELVEKIFNETKIVIEDDDLLNLMKNNGLENVVSNSLEDDSVLGIAVSFQGDSCYFDENYSVVYDKSNPIIICSSKNCSEEDLLNFFVHEANHILKSQINSVEINKNSYTIRSGFNTYTCSIDMENAYFIEKNVLFDEAINVLQTSDIMKQIININYDELDDDISTYLRSLDLNNLSQTRGYDLEVEMVKPLWQDEHFKNSIKENSIIGDVSAMENDFNEVLGVDCFNAYSDALDETFDRYDDEDSIELLGNLIMDVNKIYLENVNNKDKKLDKTFKI